MVVALLGILKAGGAYVPLDPAIRPTASPTCWRTRGVPVVLAQAHLLDRLPSIGPKW